MRRVFLSIFALLALVLAASANMPGTFQPLLIAQPIVPIGTPTLFATPYSTAGTAPAASFTFTTTANITAGNLLVCVVSFSSGTASPDTITVSSISDGTNSYTRAVQAGGAGATYGRSDLWYKQGAAAVGSGATVTVTMSAGGAGGSTGTAVACSQNSGIPAAPLDVTNNNATNTATPSISTGTLAKANEIIFGTSYNSNQTLAYTESAGFTNLTSASGTGISYGIGYKITAATTTLNYAPTWPAVGALSVTTLLASFKGN